MNGFSYRIGDLIITRYDVLVHLKFNDRKEFTYWSTTYSKLITSEWMGAYVGEMPSEDA